MITKSIHQRSRLLVAVFCAVAVLGFAGQSRAGFVTFELDTPFSPPGSSLSPEALTATFLDTGANEVTLTMAATAANDVFQWYFNFDDALDLDLLMFAYVGGSSTGPEADSITKDENDLQADGDGKFDLLFDFPQSGDQFDLGEVVVYTITSSETITAMSFDFDSEPMGGHGPFRSAAQASPLSGNSSWVGHDGPGIIPEPASLALLGLAGLCFLWRRRRIA